MSSIIPWRNWYHCMGNTYGTWLPGEAKGFRTRHHREHLEGDYKFPPPPGFYDTLFETSRKLMVRGAVFIPRELRAQVCRIFANALTHHQVEVVTLSMGGVHWHLLARFVPVGVDPYAHLATLNVKLTHHPRESPPAPADGNPGNSLTAYDHDPAPRRILGLVRSYTTRQLKAAGHFTNVSGGLWAQRPKCQPVSCRSHQVAVARYIARHAEQRAAVWSPRG